MTIEPIQLTKEDIESLYPKYFSLVKERVMDQWPEAKENPSILNNKLCQPGLLHLFLTSVRLPE